MIKAALSLALLLAACTASPRATIADALRPTSVRGAAGYEDARGELRRLVARDGGPVENRFCVVGYRNAAGIQHAYVHWSERRRLILWEGGDLLMARRTLDLDKDVVASEREVGGSSYLVTRAWSDGVIADCGRHGDRYRIRR